MLIGGHVSTRGGIDKSIGNAVAIGAEVFQTHPTPGQTWRSLRLDDETLAAYNEQYSASGLRGRHWLHAVYLINLGTPKEALLRQSIGSLVHYMDLATQLDAAGVVFHPGSHLGAGFDTMLPQVLSALREVLDRSDSTVRLLVENSAGSGGCIGCTFEELGRMVHGVDDSRIGVCLDTQHMFASGYDMRSPETVATTLDDFARDVGFDRLVLVHANDSRKPLGSNVDRHANIGEGEIGVSAFQHLLADGRVRNVPWLLEVPGDGHGPNIAQINLLRNCAGLAPAPVLEPTPA